MADSRLCKLSLRLIFATLSWSTTIAFSFLDLPEEDCFGHAHVFHPCDVASLTQLHLCGPVAEGFRRRTLASNLDLPEIPPRDLYLDI